MVRQSLVVSLLAACIVGPFHAQVQTAKDFRLDLALGEPASLLGEAYAADGDKEWAIANYARSLDINPGNQGAIAALKRLRGGA